MTSGQNNPQKKSNEVKIVEVGLRDGLQNEARSLGVPIRLSFARRLVEAGLRHIELGAFVSPKWVPQMADSRELIEQTYSLIKTQQWEPPVRFSALVPNVKGMEKATQTPIDEVAIFAACTETFSEKNINCSIQESFERFRPVVALARSHNIQVRGYLSTCFGCPYEGDVDPQQVLQVARQMKALGVYELSIGDTIGVADPRQVRRLVSLLLQEFSEHELAMHFHNTRGTALANILASVDLGIRVFDASLGGLGGCPYAPGASGNVATEDVVYMLHRMGFSTGIDLGKLIEVNHWVAEQMGRPLTSHLGQVGIETVLCDLPSQKKN